MMADAPKLGEIASRISVHLKRIEAKQSAPGKPFYMALAWSAGSRIGVRYVSYQYSWKLTKAEAMKYLEWLDSGNDGKHHNALQLQKTEP
jgi:hypothetical protein